MQRTYRSKKDTVGVFDHKDALLAMDEKSSAFDAFYIQNIKQTKKEMSCLGSTNQFAGPSKKDRKRKYVRRIVKDPEPVCLQESLSNSVYMTPDRSIHVKKAPDLFDQLLNSSGNQNNSPRSSRAKLIGIPVCNRGSKTYMPKKTTKARKFNYSSSESDSEKENSADNLNSTENTTNINIQKLLIEKQDFPQSKQIDLSICNILEKLPELNKMANNRSSINNSRVSFKPHRHRLTKNLNSSLVDHGPLSSTPFKKQIRSSSVYKYSPIVSQRLEDSPNYVTVTELSASPQLSEITNNESDNKPPDTDNFQSPILQTNISSKSNSFNKKKQNKSKNNAKNVDLNLDSFKEVPIKSDGVIPAIEQLETTESKLFLGFSNLTSHVELNSVIEEDIDIEDVPAQNAVQLLNKSDVTKKKQSLKFSNLQTTEDEEFLGFTHNSSVRISKLEKLCIEDSCLLNSSNDSEEQITINNQKDVNSFKSQDKSKEIDNIVDVRCDVTTSEINSSFPESLDNKFKNLDKSMNDEYGYNNESDRSLLEESDNDRISCYDTCNSEDSGTDDGINDVIGKVKLPNIEIVRLRTSIFDHYYKRLISGKTSGSFSDNSSLSDNSDVSNIEADLTNSSYSSQCSEESNVSNFETNTIAKSLDNLVKNKIPNDSSKDIQEHIILSSSEGDCTDFNSNDDDCVSFVTTRRKHEVINNRSLFMLDNTVCSPSSSDCDKTVIEGKNDGHKNSNETEASNSNYLLKEWNELQKERKTMCKRKHNVRNSVSPRKSTGIARHSLNQDETLKSDVKDAIVLKPGKKWERSLSIYRRMTQMTDSFDQSIIDEECAHKGRNYRQSVINTMESQDLGSVHNVSISSRRSTFLSKPSRSTVCLIKDSSISRLSTTAVFDDLKGFLHEDCNDTVLELSKLSIADPERDITVIENFDDCDRVVQERGTTARDYVLRRCNQSDVILFDECYPEPDLKNCHKIGEGVYGEVFLWRAKDGHARVMKIVPIAGTIKVNGEHQKDYSEIIAEIVIAMELSALRSPLADIERSLDEGRDIETLDLHSIGNATDVFNEVLGVHCVYGPYPSRLLDLWELYDEVKGSENDNPAILPPQQQYVVLELANAGQDLETFQFASAEQAHALFWQVAFGLAVGEEAFQLEHRDLHWGNVLIAPTDQKWATFVLRGRAHRVARRGVRASVIDYSLSRISLPLPGAAAAALYNDLAADDSLFSAVGDRQFEVYRLMRDKLRNEWKNFEPYTNILWLHYIVDKMITALRYKRTNTKIHKHYIAKLKGIKNRILQYGSATQFVLTDNEI